MLSFAIIVFREVLEIALVLVVLLAGTRALAGRGRWIWAGIGAGLLGSCAVAYFAEQISNAMEGFGQEVFNATVLFFAAVMIAGTVIWMKRHARQISANLKNISGEIACGKRPCSVLAGVVGLSVLRDGAEVVLLSHGVLASGQQVSDIVVGSIVGIAFGAVVGAAIYYGIIKSATRHIFTVTNFLLVVLSAGMVSQAVGFLSQADLIPQLIPTVWDTSWIVSEQSYLGQTLHVLIGYTSRPSGIQLLCYLATIAIILLSLRVHDSSSQVKRTAALAVGMVALFAITIFTASKAYAADKIYSPIVHSGELELETRGTFDLDHRDDKNRKYKQKLGLGYGLTDRYAVEVLGEVEKEHGEDAKIEAWELENRLQLTEQGEYWIDSGLYLAMEWLPDDDEYELEGRILLEKETGSLINTANFEFHRGVFGAGNPPVEAEASWATRYRLMPTFEPGFEVHLEVGGLQDVKPMKDQEYSVGPFIYGTYDKFHYVIATLAGVTKEAPDFTLRFELEYEWFL